MPELLTGAIALGSGAVALFFLKYWRQTRDRFFLYFALSFLMECINRIIASMTGIMREDVPVFYIIRLISYGLILLAIWEKNRSRRKP